MEGMTYALKAVVESSVTAVRVKNAASGDEYPFSLIF